jgi:ribosomal protein L23
VFPIKLSTSKQEVIKMVEKEFNVTVTDVRTLIRNGKKTKFSKGKHAYPGITHRQDKKFAYVTLKEGDSIKVFEEPEKEEKKTVKPAKSAKKEDK